MHFEQFMENRRLRGGSHAAMVDGAKRMNFAVDFGHHAIGVRGFGGVEQLLEKNLGNVRHIAGNEKIPIGLGMAKRGPEAAEGAAIFDGIGNHGETQAPVFIGRADESHIAGRTADDRGDLFDHTRSVERQEGFIASHAAAGSADQNEPRVSHEMILATSGHIVELNKRVYICFLVAFAMLAASPSRAAESIPAMTAPVVRKTTVVRTDPRTGKLVRSVMVSSVAIHGSSPQLHGDLNAIVDKAAKAHDVDPLLVHSIIKQESNYNVHAVSNKGAEGLMQLTPSTARMLGVSNSFDPEQNIEAGVKYLKYLQDLYKDDKLALAAYNAGPGSVNKYNAIPPYAETQNYVYQVEKRYAGAKREADAAKPAPAEVTTVEEKPAEAKPAAVEPFIDENGRLHLKTTQ